MNFGGRLFAGRLFAGQLFGRQRPRAAAIAGGGNWMVDEATAVETRKRKRPQIQAQNMMLIATLLAVAQGDSDGSVA